MIEQLSDSGFTGGCLAAGSVTSNEKQQPLVVKKQALRDLPNENNVAITKSKDDSTLQKERVPVKDPDRVSGTKRLSSEVNPPLSQDPNAANTNGNLVYVRRKTEVEVGKIPSSGTAGNNSNADLLLSVKAPVSNERVQPSPIPNKPHTDACNISHSAEPSLNPANVPVDPQNKSQLPDPHKSGTILPSKEDTCLLPRPDGKSGNTISVAPDNKCVPVGFSGNTDSSVENKSPNPNPPGMPGKSAVSSENKSPPHPLVNSGNTMPSAENKPRPSHPLGNSEVITASAEIRSLIPPPVENSEVIRFVENRSSIPSLGKSGNIISSAGNNHIPPAPVITKLDLSKESNNKLLQHQQVHPRISLRGLDRSAHEEYLQMLRSLSSAELSRLAVELERRAIQLSLEEAREIARTEMLNVMGKSNKSSKSPSDLP